MKQVKIIVVLLLLTSVAFSQTVTPDPGPYSTMNQKYVYRWIKTSGGIWNIGKFIVEDSAQFLGQTYVPTAPDGDSSLRAANTEWIKINIAPGVPGQPTSAWVYRGNYSDADPTNGRLGFKDSFPLHIITNDQIRLTVPDNGIKRSSAGINKYLTFDTVTKKMYYADGGSGGSSVTVTDYSKNLAGDSAILLLSDGTRYAAKDSVGSGGGGGSDTLKVSVSDTSAMLAPYLNKNTNRAAYTLFGNRTASIAQPNFFLNPYIDSIKVSTDTIFGRVNGSWIYQQKTPAFANWLTDGSNIYTTAVRTESRSSLTSPPNALSGGIILSNPGTSSVGVAQFPGLMGWEGSYYNYTTSASRRVGIYARLKPIPNVTNAVNNTLEFYGSDGGNTYANIMSIYTKSGGTDGAVAINVAPSYEGGVGLTVGGLVRSSQGFAGFFFGDGGTNNALLYSNKSNSFVGKAGFSVGGNYGSVSNNWTEWATPIPFTVGSYNKPDASAQIDIISTTRGVLMPRMTSTQKNAIASPAEGLMIYDLTLHKLCVYTGSAWETVTSL